MTFLLLGISAYYLSFTFKARSVQADATEYATNAKGNTDPYKKQAYLDSIYTKPVYNLFGIEYTYKEVKEKELALGLDLQGGMEITLEVSPIEIIRALANNKPNANFQKALRLAQERQQNSQQSFIDLFAAAYEEVEPNVKFSSIFTNTTTRGKITITSTNDEIVQVIRDEVADAFDRSFNIIRTRIDKFGVTNPNIQKIPGTNRILVELPGVDNPERVRKLLSGVAKLEFWEVWNMQDVFPYYQQFVSYLDQEEKLKKAGQPKTEKETESGLVADTQAADTAKTSNDPLIAETNKDTTKQAENPLLVGADSADDTKDSNQVAKTAEGDSAKKDSTETASSLAMQLITPTQEGFMVKIKDTSRVNQILARSEVKRLFPNNIKFLWDVKGNEASGMVTLYPIKTGRGGKAPLGGEVVIDARQDFDENNPSVSMQMNSTGAKVWRKLTANNVGNRIAIVLDDAVYSAPNVNGEIPNGSSVIQGSFTVNEAKDLANVLKAGKLPAPIRIVEEATVGPSLGKESIAQGLNSMLLGLGIVLVFMFLYYRNSGLVANLALFLNIIFIVGVLASFGAVLTLPGIAGIVLTIGMSVDANVLIFERVREELANNRSYKNAITEGYTKAMSAIVDSNATTFLTGLILYLNGTGGVKGFAVTLMIGIACSLFSAIFITRLVIEYFTRKADSKAIRFDGFIMKNTFNNINIDFVKLRRNAYIFSGVLIVAGIGLMIYPGLTLGVDFKGGRSYIVEFDTPVSVKNAREEIGKEIKEGTEVKTYGSNNKLKITTSYMIEDESAAADEKVKAEVMKGLEAFKEKSPKVVGFSKVGATIADDIAQTSYKSVLFSFLVIFLYIFVRIGRLKYWQYSVGALVALVHDVLIVIAFMGLAKLLGISYEVDQVFIAAMLTVVGYSINDTVVVFDRIKEMVGTTKRDMNSKDFLDNVNNAINTTLSRTIMTSSTTLLVVLCLFLFGGQVLGGFSYSLLIGILIGTYSSVFIASPIFVDISLLLRKREKLDVKGS